MARYKASRGQIFDSLTSRWEGPYTPERLRELNNEPEPATTPETLAEMNVSDLRSRAKELGITGYSSWTKDTLIEEIEAAEDALAAGDTEDDDSDDNEDAENADDSAGEDSSGE